MSQIEIVPLTDDQKAAIRECRFAFTNQDRTVAWGMTYDLSVAERCPGGATAFTRSRKPTLLEYEAMMAHPEAVALVVEMQEKRKAA